MLLDYLAKSFSFNANESIEEEFSKYSKIQLNYASDHSHSVTTQRQLECSSNQQNNNKQHSNASQVNSIASYNNDRSQLKSVATYNNNNNNNTSFEGKIIVP